MRHWTTSGTYFWWWPVLGQYEATSQHYRCHRDDRSRASLPGAHRHVTPCVFEVPQPSRTKCSSSLQASVTHKVFLSMLYVDHTKAHPNASPTFTRFPSLSHSQHLREVKFAQALTVHQAPVAETRYLEPSFMGSNDLGQTNEHVFCTMLSPSCHHANLLSLASKPVLEQHQTKPDPLKGNSRSAVF